MRHPLKAGVLIGMAAVLAGPAQAQLADPYASAESLHASMRRGKATSEVLVKESLARIKSLDRNGPRLNAVIALNPHALADARARDQAHAKGGGGKGPLDGIPILLKDNIESDDGTATTAGSLALKDNVTGRDAPIVRRLTDAGVIILGKANLSEWANFRSSHSVSGWSAVGGLVRNPYALDRSACGSSSGSAAAVAAGYTPLAIGTETDGSITCPAAANGVVGFKPTLGLVSRSLIVPISPRQDTAGPIARTVTDAASLLTIIAGTDRTDPATAEADARKTDFAAGLDRGALQGLRIGVLDGTGGSLAETEAVFSRALHVLTDAGAVLVQVERPGPAQREQMGSAELAALTAEFKAAINTYLANTPRGVRVRSLDDLVAFNRASGAEMALFGQDLLEQTAQSPDLTDPAYQALRADADRLAGPEGLERMFSSSNVDLIVAVTGGPAWLSDPVGGDNFSGSAAALPAISGAPHLTVPMGQVKGLPVGLSFIGPRWSDAKVLSAGYAYEQLSKAWKPPTFAGSVSGAVQAVGAAYDLR